MPLRRVLAVSHLATITGAPMNLLHLLRWMREQDGVEVHTLILQGGPMVARFAEVGDVTVIDRAVSAKLLALLERAFDKLGAEQLEAFVTDARLGPQLRSLQGFDLAYLNSATSIALAPHLPPVRAVVSHVHELEVAVRTMEPPLLESLRTRPDAWIAASEPVRDLLTLELGIDAERVRVHEEFIDVNAIANRTVSVRQVERCRRRLPDLPSSAAIVLGCGTLDWRKGPDLFIQLANEVRRRTRRPVHFVWLGGEHAGVDWERVRSDRDRAGADHVHFVETADDPVPWFAAADVFALTSREDPLPLVCLEAGAMGTPVVSYRSGGIPGLLQRSGTTAAAGIIDHLDVGAMATRVLELLHSDELRLRAGDELRRRVAGGHDVHVVAPRLVADLNRLVAD